MAAISESFTVRFNKALEIRNVRPVDIAKLTGMSESVISQYRRGYAQPKREKLNELAVALKVSPVWLMGYDVDMDVRNENELINIVKDLNAEQIKRVIAYAKFIKQNPDE